MKYLLAVSGGIDSMALFDMTATNHDGFRDKHFAGAKFPDDFIVAHFDHGIRGEQSHQDAEFVRKRCADYGVNCVVGNGNLPADASEEAARYARRRFVNAESKKLQQEWSTSGGNDLAFVVTAHHFDDLIETVVMFMVRGTGWRGLAPFSPYALYKRPLLDTPKADLVKYMIERDLPWVQDETNYSTKYFRNRLRMIIEGWPADKKRQLAALAMRQRELVLSIDGATADYINLRASGNESEWYIRRYYLIMLPDDVALEAIRYLTCGRLLRPQMQELLFFIKTALPGKKMKWQTMNVRVDIAKVYFSMPQQNIT